MFYILSAPHLCTLVSSRKKVKCSSCLILVWSYGLKSAIRRNQNDLQITACQSNPFWYNVQLLFSLSSVSYFKHHKGQSTARGVTLFQHLPWVNLQIWVYRNMLRSSNRPQEEMPCKTSSNICTSSGSTVSSSPCSLRKKKKTVCPHSHPASRRPSLGNWTIARCTGGTNLDEQNSFERPGCLFQ